MSAFLGLASEGGGIGTVLANLYPVIGMGIQLGIGAGAAIGASTGFSSGAWGDGRDEW